MENDSSLDLIPRGLALGKLGADEAAMKIMEVIYTNPGRFNLLDMEEDERSDFLLEMLPKFKGLVERYDESLGPMGAYVYYSIPGMRRTWARKKGEDETGRRAVASGVKAAVKSIYEDAIQRRPLFLQVAEPVPPAKKGGFSEAFEPLVFKRVFERTQSLLETRDELYKKRSALLLALKSAWYIDDKSVRRLSGYLGCSSEGMAMALAEIKNSLIKRNEKRERLEELRDKAWYFVCKYRERLLSLEPGSEEWARVKKKLDYQLSSWKNKTRLLQGCRMNVSPRNNELAKLLDVRPYRISAFLKYARKMVEEGETLVSSESQEEE